MAEYFTHKSFLVVDDYADMRTAIRSILRSLGVNLIDQARDGNDAIAQMSSKRYDVVLCDYNLGPGKDGQQVLEEARYRHLIGVDTIFVMITAENTREMVMGAVEFAPDNYLSKPFTKELLGTRLAKLFERKADLKAVNKALMAKDFAAAIAQLDRLIAAGPKNLPELYKLEAEICLDARRLDEAMAIYERILATREVPWARLGVGKVLFGRKLYAQAQEVFRELVARDPNLIVAYDWLAKTQTALQQFADAEQTLQAASRLSPRGLARQQLLGDLALGNGNTLVAETAFTRAVALAKNSVLNHPALFARLARSKSANGRHAEALKVVGEIGKVFTDQAEAPFYAATAAAIVKQSAGDAAGAREALSAAEDCLNRLGSGTSASTTALEMAKAYSQLGESDKAAALLNRVIANNHDDEDLLMELVQVCHQTGLEYDAEAAIREIREHVVKTNNLGVRLIKQGEFAAAIAHLRTAAEEMPDNKTISLNVAKAIIMKMEKMGATDQEVEAVGQCIERVRRLAPNDWRLADIVSRLRQLSPKP